MPKNQFQPRHGRASRAAKKSRTYRAWESMRARCNYVHGPNYHRYGGRGIRVCERWVSFENFVEDMGECPDGMSLERKDNDGHYEPGNCRWATHVEQCANRRTSRLVTHMGRTQTLKAWSEEFGINYNTAFYRLKRGWSIERALTPPPNEKGDAR